MPLAVVFLYGASGGREPWRHRLRNRVTGLPWHCLLYLGEDDITFDATPEHGVRMHPIGRATLTRVLGGTVFTVLEPPVVSLMPCDVQTNRSGPMRLPKPRRWRVPATNPPPAHRSRQGAPRLSACRVLPATRF